MKRKIFWTGLVVVLMAFSYASFAWFKSHRSSQILGKCIHRVNTPMKVVALTFDDGPSQHTEEFKNSSFEGSTRDLLFARTKCRAVPSPRAANS